MTSPPDDPLRGIALFLAATTLFAVADTIAKFLTAELPVVQINWMRYLIFAAMALVLSTRTPGQPFRVQRPRLQLLRGLCVASASILFIFAIRDLPLAEAASIGFVAPLLITVLSIPLLGEVVGIRRWAAVVVGLIGVLVVMRPGTGAFQPAALLVLASASCWSLGLILTRKMAGTERAATTLLWSACTGLAMLSVLLPFHFQMPTAAQLGLALVQGILSSVGQWMVIQAHRTAPASTLAPIIYAQLIWSTLAGYIVFGAFPDGWTIVGAAIIIGSGLYTAHRERVRAQEKRNATRA